MNLGMDIEPSWSLVRLIVPLEEVELVVDDLLTRGAAAVEEIDSGEGLVVLRTSLGGGAGDSLVGLVERFPGISIVEEQVPRHRAHGGEHALVADAAFGAQALDHAVAGALRGHAQALRFGLEVEAWGHAPPFRLSPRPPTQLATFSSAW